MSDSSSNNDRKYIVPAVERAILILQLLSQEPDGLTISQITQQLPIAKSTVFTILTTLKFYGLVERIEETGQYLLGMELFTLGSIVIERLDVRSRAYPILKRLAHETEMTAHLGILDQGEVVYIEKIDGEQGPIKISSAVGRRMKAHCTALGKAMIAQLPESELQDILEKHGLPRRTPNTITSLELLRDDLARIKARGYSFDDEENELSIRCIGAPIYNYRREVACAISISSTRDKITRERVDELAPQIKTAAMEISEALGYVAR